MFFDVDSKLIAALESQSLELTSRNNGSDTFAYQEDPGYLDKENDDSDETPGTLGKFNRFQPPSDAPPLTTGESPCETPPKKETGAP